MVERTRLRDGCRVLVEDRPPRPGQNILPRGREMRREETVLAAGTVLRPQEFGLLATVGRTTARVVPAPVVAVLSTGDEVSTACGRWWRRACRRRY
jgi:molybdopterin molybdotransferase